MKNLLLAILTNLTRPITIRVTETGVEIGE